MLLTLAVVGCVETAAPEKPEPTQPPAVRQAECRWAEGNITLDGKLDEPAWQKAQMLKDFSAFWQGRKPRTATTARLLWNDKYLYFAAEMEDSDVYALVTEHNGQTWYDDVFELFFKPALDKFAYYEFQVNAANTGMEIFMPSRGSGGYNRFYRTSKHGLRSAVIVHGTLNRWQDKDKGWTVEGRIPWTGFKATGGKPDKGTVWKFALCRYDYSAAHESPDLSSTAPLTQPDFHRYEDYGDLTFVGPAE